jgi:DNA-binding SARP family transcriptional activator/WD40 repeat protein
MSFGDDPQFLLSVCSLPKKSGFSSRAVLQAQQRPLAIQSRSASGCCPTTTRSRLSRPAPSSTRTDWRPERRARTSADVEAPEEQVGVGIAIERDRVEEACGVDRNRITGDGGRPGTYSDAVDFSVLGPLRVEGPDGAIEIRGAKERLLLARLIAAGGRLVPARALIDTLWGEEPPASAARSLQTFVHRLRNSLEPDRRGTPVLLLTDGPGYRLAVRPDQVDSERFVSLAHTGERALADGRPESAVATLTEALGLWRGPAYAGFEHADFARAEAFRLAELRVTAHESQLAAELAVGHASGVVPELERLIGEHPMREHLWELLLTALYRCGRQGDALVAYDRARSVLAEELGIDPGLGLRAIHARILAHDPSLGSPTVRSPLQPELRPARALVGREEELCRLREAWHAAIGQGTRTVVLRGPEGGGASALAAALAAEVSREGATVRYRASTITQDDERPVDGSILLVADHTDGTGPATLVLRLAGPLGAVPAGAEVIDLRPLSRADVRRIVAEYMPAEIALRLSEEVFARTGGWPGRVHEAALDIARTRAARRVEVAAAAAGSSSAELAQARVELTEGIELLRDTDADAGPLDPGVCPWRGLRSYEVEDARWFAGRERLVAQLVARLAGARLLSLVGASGSGKSSVLRAGLLAALASDVLPGSAGWRVVTLRPGAHPMRGLARRSLGPADPDEAADPLGQLVSAPGGHDGRVIVAVDQFEEVWTVCSDDGERRQFLDTLAELATDSRSPVSVVVAVRADFMGKLADHDALSALVNDGTVLVGALTPSEVRRAIRRPATAAHLVLDDGLADTIVSDAGDEPGLLPLLSATMTQLWERREGAALTYAAYVGLGNLSGAIATLAEETYAKLSASQRETARHLLLRLTGAGDAAGVTRRRVPTTEVFSLPRPDVREVVEELSAGRLLTVSDGAVEVAHEALFREWPRLRAWLVEDASGRAVQRRLAVSAAEWDAEGREPSGLWTGARLASGLDVARVRPDELTPVEREFLEAGRQALDAEQRLAEERAAATSRQNRRLRRLVAGVGVMLVVALVAGLLAWRAQREAEAASVSAEAKGLAASALNIEYPDMALLAAVESTKLEQSPETYGALLTLLARQPQVAHRVRTESRFRRIAATPDGSTVFVTEDKPFIRAIDAESGETLWNVRMPATGQAYDGPGSWAPAVTEDGRGVIAPEESYADPGIVRLDAATGEVVWKLRDIDRRVPGSMEFVLSGGLRADSAYVAATETHLLTVDPETGEVLEAVAWPEGTGFDFFLVWPDGRVSVGYEAPARSGLFDPRRPELGMVELAGIPTSFSPDGSRVVMLIPDDAGTTVRIASTDDPAAETPSVRVPSLVRAAPWSPDGTQVALTVDQGIQVLDTETLRLGRVSLAHSGAVLGASFAGSDGALVWTAGGDGTAVGFDLSGRLTPIATTRTGLAPALGHASLSAMRGVYLDLVFTGTPHLVHVTDLSTGTNLGDLVPDIDGNDGKWPPEVIFEPNSVAITADGETAVVGVHGFTWDEGYVVDRGVLAIFDASTQRQTALVDLPWSVHSVDVTPDGRRAVVNGRGGYAIVDLATADLALGPVQLNESRTIDGTTATQVSPDGRLAALARNDQIVLVDLATGKVARRGPVASAPDQLVQAIAWTNDSRTIAAGADDGRLHVVSADTLEPVAPPRLITGGWVTDLEVAPDGRTMASIGSDGDVTLWDTATWRPYGQPVTDDRAWGWLTFTADGSDLRVFFEGGEVVQISVDPRDWVAAACSAAGRNLTAEEAAVILRGRPLEATCPEHDLGSP